MCALHDGDRLDEVQLPERISIQLLANTLIKCVRADALESLFDDEVACVFFTIIIIIILYFGWATRE